MKISAHFKTLAEAVAASKLDLSYNEAHAESRIKQLDSKFGGYAAEVEEAFLLENGEVWFIYKSDIRILHKFEPFCSILDDSSFNIVLIEEEEFKILDSGIRRDKESRRLIAKGNLIVTTRSARRITL